MAGILNIRDPATGKFLPVPAIVGPGVPAGGTAGQVLVKSGDADYEVEWRENDASKLGGKAASEYANASIISDAWSDGHAYAAGEYAIYNGSLWRCLVANTGVTPTEGSNWTRCSLSDELKKNIASIVNPTVMNPNNSAATLIAGGYVRIGRLTVINIRASVGAVEEDAILFTGFPIPLSTAANVVRLNCQIDCFVDPNGNMRSGEKIAASRNLMINGVYITQA